MDVFTLTLTVPCSRSPALMSYLLSVDFKGHLPDTAAFTIIYLHCNFGYLTLMNICLYHFSTRLCMDNLSFLYMYEMDTIFHFQSDSGGNK